MTSVEEDFLKAKDKLSKLFEVSLNEESDNLRNYLLYVYGPISDYVESAICLTKSGHINASKVILRTLVEAHIKINYYQISDKKVDSYKKLAVAAKVDFENKAKTVSEFSKLIEKHPSLINDNSDLYNPKGQERMINFAKKQKENIIALNDVTEADTELKLKDMAMKCDEAALDGAGPGYFLNFYTLMYRYLSPVAHLTVEGIDHFFEKNENGKVVYRVSDESPEVNHLSVSIWIALVKDLFDKKVILSTIPEEIKNLESRLKKGVYN